MLSMSLCFLILSRGLVIAKKIFCYMEVNTGFLFKEIKAILPRLYGKKL